MSFGLDIPLSLQGEGPGRGLDPSLDAATLAAAERLYARRRGYLAAKRTFDVLFSTIVLVAFSPLMVLTALAIRLDSPGPAFFRQPRSTVGGRSFDMWKFRTMCADAEEQLDSLLSLNEKDGPVFKIKNDPRLTRVGRLIRKVNLDELPQFLNVLAGDMSVVGPRPALPREVEHYEPWQRQRLLVKSGITCYWQVLSDRDDIPFDDWVRLDLRYIRECSLATDLKLIVRTVGVVLEAKGS